MIKPEGLEQLYQATEEDLAYGIGTIAAPGNRAVPFIQVCYRQWTREKLELVRSTFKAGVAVTISRPTGGTCDIHVSTRTRITVQAEQAGHTSVLRAPAWDARLAGMHEAVVRRFEAGRVKSGGFLLALITAAWQYVTAVDDIRDRTIVGPILSRSFPLPAGSITP